MGQYGKKTKRSRADMEGGSDGSEQPLDAKRSRSSGGDASSSSRAGQPKSRKRKASGSPAGGDGGGAQPAAKKKKKAKLTADGLRELVRQHGEIDLLIATHRWVIRGGVELKLQVGHVTRRVRARRALASGSSEIRTSCAARARARRACVSSSRLDLTAGRGVNFGNRTKSFFRKAKRSKTT